MAIRISYRKFIRVLWVQKKTHEEPFSEYHPLHVLDSLFPKSHYTYICPLCLEEAEGGYYRLYWRMPYLLSCLKHHVVLQRHCPSVSTAHSCATKGPLSLHIVSDRRLSTSSRLLSLDERPSLYGRTPHSERAWHSIHNLCSTAWGTDDIAIATAWAARLSIFVHSNEVLLTQFESEGGYVLFRHDVPFVSLPGDHIITWRNPFLDMQRHATRTQ